MPMISLRSMQTVADRAAGLPTRACDRVHMALRPQPPCKCGEACTCACMFALVYLDCGPSDRRVPSGEDPCPPNAPQPRGRQLLAVQSAHLPSTWLHLPHSPLRALSMTHTHAAAGLRSRSPACTSLLLPYQPPPALPGTGGRARRPPRLVTVAGMGPLALSLAFLPVKGCDAGGYYATGEPSACAAAGSGACMRVTAAGGSCPPAAGRPPRQGVLRLCILARQHQIRRLTLPQACQEGLAWTA